tara:strand:+ start:1150 stop:1764 length:615 start_codon:yes stop_codon:yes gene_type:complete
MNTLGSDDEISTPVHNLRNDYKYPEWYNMKQFLFYKKIYKRLKILVEIHSETSNYYNRLDKYIFGPSIIISCLSGIGSFMSTSEFIDNRMQNIFGISVGIMASVAALIQSIGSATRYSAKEEAHRTAAEDYNKLSVKVKFEIEMPNEENFQDILENAILDIQNKCKYFSPQFIVDKHTKFKIQDNVVYTDDEELHSPDPRLTLV